MLGRNQIATSPGEACGSGLEQSIVSACMLETRQRRSGNKSKEDEKRFPIIVDMSRIDMLWSEVERIETSALVGVS